ncbi:MAG: DUF4214 domain-containing protein [Sulfurimonas sp.]|nr:DUF4214 domain-containing protein [Sulfurimonas sp.]
MEENRLLLSELYTAYFNRAPDAAGLAYWLNELDNNVMDFGSIASNWANEQQEFTDTYGEDADSSVLITQVYANVLGRSPDTAGTTYWAAELASGNIPMDQFVLAIVNGAKASTGSSSDAALLNNKAQVGIAMADAGINDLAFAAQVIATVTADSSTVGIVESVITMAAADTAGLANATATLESVQAILADTDSAATLTTTLANLKTVMQNLAEDVTAGTVTNIAATLTAATATVEAATQDASFVANPETLATSIAANPTAVEEDAAAVVEEATTPTTLPSGGSSGGGGSSAPATPTFTVTDTEGVVTFGGTATGNISMSITEDVATFTRGGINATTTALLSGEGAITKITVASGQTLADSAADLTELTIDGAGTVAISALESTLAADLSGITATNVTATVTTTTGTPVDFTGDFGEATVTISGDGFLRVDNATIGTATFIVGADSILQGTSTVLSGVTTSGAGYVTIMPLATDTDATNLTASDVAAVVSATVDISTNTNLSSIDRYSVSNEQTLTLTAAQAVSKSISGAGSVTVKDIAEDTDFSTITASGTLSATVTSTVDLTSANLTGLDALSVTDGADTAIAVTVTPEQYAALVGKVTLGANDTLVSTDTTIPTSTTTSAAFDENTIVLTITGANFDTILESAESATTDVKGRLDWTKLSWDINGDNATTANVSFAASDITSAKVTNATTLTITLTSTKAAALLGTTGYGAAGTADTIDITAGFIRDMSLNAATTDAMADGVNTITADSTAPTIASVEVANGTYGIGDTVAVTVSAGNSEAGLTLAGTFNGQTLTAITDNEDGTYTGTYTVVSADASVADAGSVTTSITLTDAASNASSETTSVTLSGESIDATAPTVAISTIATDDKINATEDNSAVSIAGTSSGADGQTVTIVVGGSLTKTATIASGGAWSVELTTGEAIALAESDAISVTADVSDAAGNPATQATKTIAHDTTAQIVSTIAITSATGHNTSIGTINGGSLITVTVAFDEVVTITGTPQVGLAVGSDTVQASYLSGSGTSSIVFKTTDNLFNKTDENGVAIAENALSLNNGTIKDATGNDATITHAAVADNSDYKLDSTAPTASAFTVTSTTVGATLTEVGELGIFNDSTGGVISNITSVTGLAANTAGTVTVAAQSAITAATLHPMDAAGNGSNEDLSLILGTIGADTTGLTEASAGQAIFGFAEADSLTLLGHTIDAATISMFADYTVNTGGDSIVCGGAAAAWANATGSGSSDATAIVEWTIASGVATRSGATVSDFYAAFAGATGTAGEVAAFEDGGNTYLFGEGVGTGDADNTAVVLVGITGITAVSATAAATTVTIA